MSRFNKTKDNTVMNEAGGQAYTKSAEVELVSLVLNSFVKDDYYRTQKQALTKLLTLMDKCSPMFCAQLALYARNEYGMRTITHIIASHLAPRLSDLNWSKRFYDKIVHRPDDMLEITAYHFDRKQKVSSAMKAGFRLAFDRFDSYQLAKYRGENKAVKLVDVANIVHPKPNEKNMEALNKLINGTLVSNDTWESKLTKAGQQAKDEEELKDLKADAWKDLISTKKIGYFALLRNLRNICSQSDEETIALALQMLVDRNLIKKSMVLPFRFDTAYRELAGFRRDVASALSTALEIALDNVPKLHGKTLIAVDSSGSMGSVWNIAKLFAAVLYKANEADMISFSNNARWQLPNPNDSIMTIAGNIENLNGGTNMSSIFRHIGNKYYDRIVILSDNENWVGFKAANAEYNAYCRRIGKTPHLYSWDLTGYSTNQFPESKLYILSGFSDKVFDVMKNLEEDKMALVNAINSVII